MLSFSLLEDFELDEDVTLFSLEEDLDFDFELLLLPSRADTLSFLSDLELLEEEDLELVGVVGRLLGLSTLLLLLALSSLPGEILSFLILLSLADEETALFPFALFGGSFCWIGSPNKS